MTHHSPKSSGEREHDRERDKKYEKLIKREKHEDRVDFRRFLKELVRGNVNIQWVDGYGPWYFRGRVSALRGTKSLYEYHWGIGKLRMDFPFKETEIEQGGL